jgi:trimeric autotransporter adhesin
MTSDFVKAILLSAGLFITLGSQAQIITTVAGDGYAGYSELSENVPADSTGLYYPAAVAVDAAGDIYIADQKNNRVRKVSVKTGLIVTIAGNGSFKHYGFSGDGGLADSAEISFPSYMAVDAAGNVYITDTHNQRIRKVTAKTNIITTVAGTRDNGYSGDNGAATSAELSNPSAVAVDAAGNIYISDFGNNRIREVDAKSGIITTIAGNGTSGYSGDGAAATAAELNNPRGLSVDAAGTVYVADFGNNCIRKISGGIITTIAGNGNSGYSGDGGAAASAQLNSPTAVAVDAFGNIYISDTYNNRIRKVSSGIITTVAGNGNKNYSGNNGPATSASLNTPYGVALDASGNLYIADYYNNRIRKVKLR